jgi:hypothetical protein
MDTIVKEPRTCTQPALNLISDGGEVPNGRFRGTKWNAQISE